MPPRAAWGDEEAAAARLQPLARGELRRDPPTRRASGGRVPRPQPHRRAGTGGQRSGTPANGHGIHFRLGHQYDHGGTGCQRSGHPVNEPFFRGVSRSPDGLHARERRRTGRGRRAARLLPGGAWPCPTATRSSPSSTGSRPGSGPWSPPTTATRPTTPRSPGTAVPGRTTASRGRPAGTSIPTWSSTRTTRCSRDATGRWTATAAGAPSWPTSWPTGARPGWWWSGSPSTTACRRRPWTRAAGYEVVVLTDATRAVNVKPDDGERALDGLRAAGVREDRAGV